MNILISACLLGVACRYDGESKPLPEETIRALTSKFHLIPVCPEQLGGLPTPRVPAEISGDTVLRRDGEDVTAAYRRGAEEVLRLCRLFDCHYAILKERSPACGNGRIYDGTFTGTLTAGDGIAADLLKQNGVHIYGERQISLLLQLFSKLIQEDRK